MDTSSFVNQLYERFLGRTADSAGRAFWVAALERAAVSPVQLTATFIDSPEFSGIVQDVSSLYYTAFGRIPDSAGLAYWLHLAQAGTPLASIGQAFTASAEFSQRFAGNSDASFIDLLYVGAVGHLPDAATRSHWLELLGQGANRATVLQGVSASAEVLAANGPAYKVIAEYHGITGLAPTQSQVEGALVQHDPLALIASLYQGASYSGVALPGMGSGAGHAGGADDPDHPPTLSSSNPADGATLSGTITLNFSEDIFAGSGNIILTDGATQTVVNPTTGALETRIVGATDTRTIAVGDSAQVHFLDQSVTITPTTPLLGSLHYSIQMAPGVLVDTGNHAFTGLADATKLDFLTADTAAPAAPTGLNLVDADDTGASNSDNLTKLGNLEITGHAEANAIVTVFDGATGLVGQAADANGNWTIDLTGLAPGVHVLTAKAVDGASNVSAASGSLTVTIDTTAPTLTNIELASAGVTTGQTDVVTLTFSEAIATLGSANFSNVGSGTLSAFGSADHITWTATFVPAVDTVSNTNTIALDLSSLQDMAGNAGVGSASSSNYTVNTRIPAAVQGAWVLSSDSGSSASDYITNVATQTLSGTYTGTLVNSQFIEVTIDSIAHVATVDTPGHWTYAIGAPLGEGSHPVGVSVATSDSAFRSATVSHSIVVDTTAPVLASTAPANGAVNVDETSNIAFTFSEPIASYNSSGSIAITRNSFFEASIFLNDPQVNVSGSTITFNPTSDLATNSDYQFGLNFAQVADAAGNVAAPPPLLFSSRDTIAPAVPGAPNLATASDSGSSDVDDRTNLTTLTFNGNGPLSTDIALYDNGNLVGTTTSNSDGIWGKVLGLSGDGVHTITAKSVDAAGNHSADSAGLAVTIDTSGPAANASSIDVVSTPVLTGQTSVVHFTFPEAVQDLSEANFTSLGNGHLSSFEAAIDRISWSAIYTPDSNVAVASATLVIDNSTLLDLAGNAGAAGSDTSTPFSVDTKIPAATVSQFQLTSDSGADSGDFVTNVASQDLAGTYAGTLDLDLGQYIEVIIDGGTPIHAVAGSPGHWTAPTGNLIDGNHVILARVSSSDGLHHSAPVQHTEIVDTVAPNVAVQSSVPGNTESNFNFALGTFVFTYSGSETLYANSAVNLTYTILTTPNNIAISDAQVALSGHTLTFTPTAGLTASNLYQVSIPATAVTDLAGNINTGAGPYVISATTALPGASGTPDLDAASDTGSIVTDNYTSDNTPSFTVSGVPLLANPGQTLAVYDNAALLSGASTHDETGGVWTFTLPTLSDGAHAITVKAVSRTGLAGDPSPALNVTIDTALATPTIPGSTDISGHLVITFGTDTVSLLGHGNLTLHDVTTPANPDIVLDIASVPSISFSGATMVLDANALGLSFGETYSATLGTGAVQDALGNTNASAILIGTFQLGSF
ncbi:MAG: Ig-like domain-containing protein [Pseudomonadota bacterium]